MLQVQVRFNNVDYPLKNLKKKMQKEGIFRMMKEKRFFEKNSEKKKRKKAESLRRRRKLNRKRYLLN